MTLQNRHQLLSHECSLTFSRMPAKQIKNAKTIFITNSNSDLKPFITQT